MTSTQKTRFISIATTLMAVLVSMALIPGVFAAEHEHKNIAFGYQPSTHQMAFMTAFEKGWYEETLGPLGISDITSFSFPTGAPEMQAMLAGEIDFAYVGSAPFVTAVSNGLDAKIIASANTQGSDLVVGTEVPYESPEDLKGLKIATFPAGTIQDTILRDWLSKNNIDADTDLEIVAMGPGDATTAILAGKVDAVFLPHPAPVTIEKAGAGRVVVPSGEMAADHSCCVLVASGHMIREHPEIVSEVLRIHLRATEFNQENPEEAAEHMNALTELSPEIILASLNQWDGSFDNDPTRIVSSVTTFAETQTRLGYLPNSVTESDLFDTSFWENL